MFPHEHRRDVQIVPGIPSQAETLSRIAWAAKAHWVYPAAWMETWRGSFTIRPEDIDRGGYFVAHSDDGQAVGFCAVIEASEKEWWLEHLWVLPGWQGSGIGRRLFAAAVACVRERGGDHFDLQADPNAESFYLRMGAVRTREVDATMGGVRRALPEMRYVLP